MEQRRLKDEKRLAKPGGSALQLFKDMLRRKGDEDELLALKTKVEFAVRKFNVS